MNTNLILNINGQRREVDLYEDIPISLVLQETDITNFDNRKSPFTKTFVVPGTSTNNKTFEIYYEVNGTDFNPLVKIDAAVQLRGTDIFNGICRLNSVIVKPNGIDYEIYIMGETADFVSDLKDLSLQELDWIDLTHSLTYDNLLKSWEARNNDVDGLFGGKIIYPMINYGLPYQDNSTTPAFTYAFSGPNAFSNPGNAIRPDVFKPAIRVKTVIDKIFENTTYTIKSDFFETEYFKSIYMDTFLNGKIGTESASGVTNQNIFRVYTNNEFILRPSQLGMTFLNFQSFRNDGYDPLNNFTLGPTNTTINQPPPPPQNSSFFRAPFAGTYSFNFQLILSGEGNIPGCFVAGQLIARKGPTLASLDSGGNFAATAPFFTNAAPTGQAINWFFTTTLNAGDYVKIGWNTSQSSCPGQAGVTFKGFLSGGVSKPAPMFELYASPVIEGPVLVDMGIGIPNLDCIQFFKALVTMFNLVIIQDETNKTLRIEPYNWYYDEKIRNKKDFTPILDLNSSYKIEPLSFDLSKQLDFTYTDAGEEILNQTFFDEKNYNYGRYRYVSTGNLLTGEQKYELPFAATPTDTVVGSEYVIIPQCYRQLEGDSRQLPYNDKPHLFFWVGNRYCYLDKFKILAGNWFLLSGSTPQLLTTYPAVSHLSSLDILLPDYVSDLNFGTDIDFFFSKNDIPVQVTSFTLYNTWWKDYIDNNYSNETRRFSGKFYFTPLDLYKTKLNDKVFVKDSYYRIEKINEGDLVNNKLTDIQLIKERGGYYKVIPPPPQYFVTSAKSTFPVLLPPTGISAYVSIDKNLVCNNTPFTLTTVYQFGSSTQLYEGGSVSFSPSGTGFIPQGTYIKDATTNKVFVVINNYGEIIEDQC
jgi:hypothetical protein